MKKKMKAVLILVVVAWSELMNTAVAQAQSQPDEFSEAKLGKFSPSIAIIIIISVVALFLMAFFSVYVRHCSDSPSIAAITNNGRSRRAARGLHPEVIQTFPILQYSEVKIHRIGKEPLECAVCLSEFEDTETLRLIPKCDHVFHPDCIDQWLTSHTTCPVCRANLLPTDSRDAQTSTPDIEAQNDAVQVDSTPPEPEPEPISIPLGKTLSWFPRSHSTGHSLLQPGENTDRFTLTLPLEVRKQLINRQLHRASSLIVLPREGSSRRGYRIGAGEGSNRGNTSTRLDRSLKSDRWIFSIAAPFFARALSIRSPRVRNRNNDLQGTSSSTAPIMPPTALDSAKPPF